MNVNQALYVSMRDQFVPSMRYTFTYSSPRRARNPRTFIFEVKESGNVTSGIYAAFGKPFNQKDKKLFNVPFAQYTVSWPSSGKNSDLLPAQASPREWEPA